MKHVQILKHIADNKMRYRKSLDNIDDVYDISVPIDYKIIIETIKEQYYFNNFIYILNLQEEFTKVAEICLSYRMSKKQFPEDFIHSVYPDKNGILPCAITENGDEIFWLTSDCDCWKIVVYENRTPNYYEYDMNISEFLYKIISKEIICPIFPDDL